MPNELESLCNASGRGVKFQTQRCRWNRLPFRQLPGMQAGEGTSAQAVLLADGLRSEREQAVISSAMCKACGQRCSSLSLQSPARVLPAGESKACLTSRQEQEPCSKSFWKFRAAAGAWCGWWTSKCHRLLVLCALC